MQNWLLIAFDWSRVFAVLFGGLQCAQHSVRAHVLGTVKPILTLMRMWTLTVTLHPVFSAMVDGCSARARRSRERNRAAQKRYRDRQRSRLAEREEQLAALTEKLSLVLNEKVRCWDAFADVCRDKTNAPSRWGRTWPA
jgi:hypothetical protein